MRMNKKIIAIIAVIIVLGGLYYLSTRNNSASKAQPVTTASKPSLADATYSTEDGMLSFKNGTAESSIGTTGMKEETVLTDMVASGDINGDGKSDAAGIFATDGVGSGVFIYLGAVISGPVSYKGTNMAFIGDRVTPKAVSISGSTITVTYLDRGPNEPFTAEPTISTTKQFIYKDGELTEK